MFFYDKKVNFDVFKKLLDCALKNEAYNLIVNMYSIPLNPSRIVLEFLGNDSYLLLWHENMDYISYPPGYIMLVSRCIHTSNSSHIIFA